MLFVHSVIFLLEEESLLLIFQALFEHESVRSSQRKNEPDTFYIDRWP